MPFVLLPEVLDRTKITKRISIQTAHVMNPHPRRLGSRRLVSREGLRCTRTRPRSCGEWDAWWALRGICSAPGSLVETYTDMEACACF